MIKIPMIVLALVAVSCLAQNPMATTKAQCDELEGIWTDYGDGHTLCVITPEPKCWASAKDALSNHYRVAQCDEELDVAVLYVKQSKQGWNKVTVSGGKRMVAVIYEFTEHPWTPRQSGYIGYSRGQEPCGDGVFCQKVLQGSLIVVEIGREPTTRNPYTPNHE